jgi:hypothetical protein
VPDKQRPAALRVEWHEQGSGDGLIDLLNDQVGYAGGFAGTPQSNVVSRGPSTANPTWVNSNQFTAGNTLNGFTFTTEQFAGWLADAGFVDSRLLEPIGFQQCIIATKARTT